MNADEIALVRQSFDALKPNAESAAKLFYGRLFERLPEVRPLFKGDMDEQGRKLMATIATVVAALDRFETVVPAVSALAQRHVTYGVQPVHYTAVGEALLWTLQQGLGPSFTPATAQAWSNAYAAVSQLMIRQSLPQAHHMSS
jgi:hemoglobin-like flavoprotein